jgi:hypothetical protein
MGCGEMDRRAQTTESFSLKKIEGELPRSELLRDGSATGLIVDGIDLNRQYQVEAGFLLFITENCPFEEGLHIYLISPELKILDGFEFDAIYTPGVVRDIELKEEEAILFSFYFDDRWELRVLEKPTWGVNLTRFSVLKRLGGPIVRRRLLLKRLA